MTDYRMGPEVLARIVQIIQEAMLLTGADASMLLWEMRVQPSSTEEGVLELTQDYKNLVKKSHEDLLEKAERLKQEAEDMAFLNQKGFDGTPPWKIDV